MLYPADRGIMYGALPGLWVNRGTNAFIPREKGNSNLQIRGTWEQRQFWGTGNNAVKEDFDFGKQGNKAIYFRGTREQVPPEGRYACLDN